MTEEHLTSTYSLPDFALIFSTLPDAYILKDSRLRWLVVNHKARELLGIKPEENLSDDFSLFENETANIIQQGDKQLLRDRSSSPQDLLVLLKNQKEKILRLERQLLHVDKGDFILCRLSSKEPSADQLEVYYFLDTIRQYLSYSPEDSFLKKVAEGIAKTLQVDYVVVSKYNSALSLMESPVFWNKGHVESFQYALQDTPCEYIILHEESVGISSSAASQFPRDKYLADWGIEGFLGVPLYDSQKQIMGSLSVMHTSEISDLYVAKAILQIYSSRIAADLERNEKEKLLRETEQQNQAILEAKVQELDEKNQQLQKYIDSNLQLENFAFIASHDLKEPLRTVSNFSQLLERRYGDQLDQDGRDFLNFIITGVKDMRQMIEGLLEYSQVSTQDTAKSALSPHLLLDEVRNSLAKRIQESAARLHIDPLPKMIQGNPVQLKQVFQNLISNAIKFHQPGKAPHIRIRCISVGAHWQFSVIDNGIGIRKEYQKYIFSLFYKLHSRLEHQGSGIGLALCREIILQHEGKIWVESQEGQGSSFYFTLQK